MSAARRIIYETDERISFSLLGLDMHRAGISCDGLFAGVRERDCGLGR